MNQKDAQARWFSMRCGIGLYKLKRRDVSDDRCLYGFGVNDPSAGSPTETLLRLLLPLNDQVCPTFQQSAAVKPPIVDPKASLSHSIGSSDGRCVQRAGT
jgi:hypothetical protein